MAKYFCTFETNAFVTFSVDAETEDEARDKVMNGEADLDETEYDGDFTFVECELEED